VVVEVEVTTVVEVAGTVVVVVTGTDPGAVGSKVATKGVCTGLGKTTGMWFRASFPDGAPSCTVTVPEPGTAWVPPAWRVPVHRVAPVDAEVTSTQQGEEVAVIVKV
jgi:hypothetical protein